MKPFLVLCAFLLLTTPLFAQTPVPSVPERIKVLVIPEIGDPVTVAPVASGETIITATSSNCNQAPNTSAAGLVNPGYAFFDDPFTAGKDCFAPIPGALPNGRYRTVGVFVVATCVDANGVTKAPCEGNRSAPSLVFTVAPILTFPVAPTGWGVKQ